MRKLNIGAGRVLADGWTNATLYPHPDDQAKPNGMCFADLTETLPWPDGQFSVVVANHVLQMIDYPSLDHAFSELYRVTAPGGVLRVLVPDIMAAFRALYEGNADWFPQITGHETSLDGRACTYLTWYGTARTVFTKRWLQELCIRAGFNIACARKFGETSTHGAADLDSREHESVIVEATKV